VRDYEVIVVIKPDIEDEDREKLVERLESWLTHGEKESDKPEVNHWGQRTLAYPIQKYQEGYYIFYVAKLDPARIGEMERNMTYQEDLLRHLVVRIES
jgi:small subunit ribosomal protein S6